MSSEDSTGISYSNQASRVAPTPVNTPLNTAPIAQGLSRPTVADIPEGEGDDEDVDAPELLDSLDGPSKQAINALMQHKLASLIGRSSGYVEGLPVPVKRRVEGLKGISVEYDKLLKKHKTEMYELEKKFLSEVSPIRKRRADIINGALEPTTEEVAAGEAVTLEDDPEATPLPSAGEESTAEKAEAGIPEFWLTALKNHIAFSTLITDRDEPALRHLVDITLEYLDGETSGFKILFHFSPNDYFEDLVLTKEYLYKDELDVEGDYLYERAVGCSIRWKEDKNLTQEIEVKRQRNKATNRTRVVRRSKPAESFFNFFSPPDPVESDDEDDMEDEELQEASENLEMDYQLGQDLKDRVIPRAIDYFTGKALEWEDDDDEDDEFDDEDDDGFDDDDDDDDEDDGPPTRRRAPKASETDEASDCKQQ